MRLFLLALFATSLFSTTPDFLSFAIGTFDINREKYRSIECEMEYKFHIEKWTPPIRNLQFVPLFGVMATVHKSLYVYAGINFDLLFFDHVIFSPGFAAGYYARGHGKNLGFPVEFRSGIELGWQFCHYHRLGIHFYHLSNASLGKRNPGEESLVFYYDIPLVQGFPFTREK